MTDRWMPLDIRHVRRGEWIVYIPVLDMTITSTSEENAKTNAAGYLEAQGYHGYSIIWRTS